MPQIGGGRMGGRWKKYDRLLINQDTDEIEQDVMEKLALPELRHKLTIFKTFDELIEAERIMNYNRGLSGGNYQVLDRIRFSTYIIKMFQLIKYMIYDKIEELRGIKTEDKTIEMNASRALYAKLVKLESGHQYPVKTLLELKNFLFSYLHKCNFTNLLIESQDDLDAFAREYQ